MDKSKTLLEILDLTDEPNIIPDIIDNLKPNQMENKEIKLENLKPCPNICQPILCDCKANECKYSDKYLHSNHKVCVTNIPNPAGMYCNPPSPYFGTTIVNDKPSTLDPNSYSFALNGETIILINERGFHYKGELLENSQDIYEIFKTYLQTIIK